MIDFLQAKQLVQKNINREALTESVPLALSANRVLAEDIYANEDIPSNDNSSVDGYALMAEDITEANVEQPIYLNIVGESVAGKPYNSLLTRGSAVRIMTGGIIPNGANAVVEIEATHEEDTRVFIRKSVPIRNYIRNAGEDISKNQLAIAKGKLLNSGDVALLAALGINNVPVKIRPIVAIISTGNELVEPHKNLLAGQIRNSTSISLYAAVASAGGEPIELGIAQDNKEDLIDKLEIGLRYDFLITTGGVSMGKYDLLPEVLNELGVENIFHKVNIKPGKPIMFGVLSEPNSPNNFVFSLPGNPVSTLITFQLFVAPAIKQMLGQVENHISLKACLKNDFVKNDNKKHFVRGVLSNNDAGNLCVEIISKQSSGAVSGMSLANCLVVVDEDTTNLRSGELVNILML